MRVDLVDGAAKRLPNANNENYQKEYAHWRGSPPIILDYHPNENAHKIIADAIVPKIKEADI